MLTQYHRVKNDRTGVKSLFCYASSMNFWGDEETTGQEQTKETIPPRLSSVNQ